MKERSNKTSQRRRAIIAALGLSAALLVGGTFAWYDFTQSADNKFQGDVVYDVELDENFDPDEWPDEEGKSIPKEVFVRNTGEDPLFVRIRLDEKLTIDGDVIQDVTTHLYNDAKPEDDGDVFHNYFSWKLGTVKTLAQWDAEGRETGAFWVLDHDGWAYWAEKLAGDDTETAYLLSSVGMTEKPDEDYEYHIYANLQAVSEKDLYKWTDGYTETEEGKDPVSFGAASASGKELLSKIAGTWTDATGEE